MSVGSIFISSFYALYFLWIIRLVIALHRVFRISELSQVKVQDDISIIIPYRNEVHRIGPLLKQLVRQCPVNQHIHIILVNDHSTDGSVELVHELTGNELNFTRLDNNGEGKKSAIRTGIDEARSKWIVTLDADVSLPDDWFHAISDTLTQSSDHMIVLPVSLTRGSRWFQHMEALEFSAMQGMTFSHAALGHFILANGAQLAFRKTTFIDIGGYNRHHHLASGDDVFLLEDLQKNRKHTIGYAFHQDLLVHTMPSETLTESLSQKLRWAGKSSSYQNWKTRSVSALILGANLGVVVMVVCKCWMTLFVTFFNQNSG